MMTSDNSPQDTTGVYGALPSTDTFPLSEGPSMVPVEEVVYGEARTFDDEMQVFNDSPEASIAFPLSEGSSQAFVDGKIYGEARIFDGDAQTFFG